MYCYYCNTCIDNTSGKCPNHCEEKTEDYRFLSETSQRKEIFVELTEIKTLLRSILETLKLKQ